MASRPGDKLASLEPRTLARRARRRSHRVRLGRSQVWYDASVGVDGSAAGSVKEGKGLMRRVSLLLALITLAACACGSDEAQLESVLREHLSGIERGDGEQACNALARPYQDQFLVDQYEGGCEARVEEYGGDLSDEERQAFEDTTITEVEFRGDQRALARTKSPAPNEDFVADAAFNMRKFPDGWKIESNNEFEAIEQP